VSFVKRGNLRAGTKGGKLTRNWSAPEKFMRPFLLAVLAALPALAGERWETLPPTPAPIATDRGGEAQVNGISIHYAIYGQGAPVIFLHGGLANTDYWGARSQRWRRIIPSF
jgi:hypothetical protein